MRRIAIIGTFAVLAVSIPEVAAGGGAVFEFERRYYAPGDTVTGRVTFGRGSGEPIRAEAGPFTAYILPGNRWIDAPRIPQGAVPVGPMRLVRSATSGHSPWVVSVDFVLPEVAPGLYSLGFCNDPCTISSMGELVGGWFHVVPTGDLISLYASRDRMAQQVRSLRGNLRRSDRRAEGLGEELREIREANEKLERKVAGLERASTTPAPRPARFPAPLGWGLVGLTIVLGLVMFRPRRRRAPLVDGPVEPPLVEWIEPSDREPALRR
jgi:hypothetical protein